MGDRCALVSKVVRPWAARQRHVEAAVRGVGNAARQKAAVRGVGSVEQQTQPPALPSPVEDAAAAVLRLSAMAARPAVQRVAQWRAAKPVVLLLPPQERGPVGSPCAHAQPPHLLVPLTRSAVVVGVEARRMGARPNLGVPPRQPAGAGVQRRSLDVSLGVRPKPADVGRLGVQPKGAVARRMQPKQPVGVGVGVGVKPSVGAESSTGAARVPALVVPVDAASAVASVATSVAVVVEAPVTPPAAVVRAASRPSVPTKRPSISTRSPFRPRPPTSDHSTPFPRAG